MDDLDLLRTLAGPDPVPSPEGEARARAALVDRFDNIAPVRRRRRGRLGWRIAIPAVVAAVAVAGVVVAENAGPVGEDGHVNSVVPGVGARPANAAEAVGYAADAAARKPFSRPRDDQWLFLERRFMIGTDAAGTVVVGGPYHSETFRSWIRVDGKKAFADKNGTLVEASMAGSGSLTWAQLAALPTNPDAVLAWVRTRTDDPVSGKARDDIAFAEIGRVLSEYLLPPAVEAAIHKGAVQAFELRVAAAIVDKPGQTG